MRFSSKQARRAARHDLVVGEEVRMMESVSGYKVLRRHKGNRVIITFLDRDNLLIAKANFSAQEWKAFIK